MKILNIKVLRGPNYWSNYRQKLIVIKLDLEQFETLPTNRLPGFAARLKALIPSLYYHQCSPGVEGGFFERLDEGTWLGHVIEHIALELQCLAGMDCGFGRTYSAREYGVYHVIFCYEIEKAGLYAAQAAMNIAKCLAEGKDYHSLAEDIAELNHLYEQEKLGPSTHAIVEEAKKRKIPYARFEDSSLVILGQGRNQKKIWATVSSETNAIAVDIAANKGMTKKLLASSFIPVPAWLTIRDLDELEGAIATIGFPLVIKPINGNHGRGITTNISAKEKAIIGFKFAQEVSSEVIVEKFVEGFDYRFLLINNQVVAVAKRTPAMIVGNGIDSIQTLIDEANKDPKRGHAHENVLTSIKTDENTLAILAEKKLSLHSVLKNGEVLILKDTANLSSGGTAADVTNKVHPYNISLAERIARLVGLDVCGIDIVSKDIGLPLNGSNGAVIEVNAAPGLRMHLAPNQGTGRNVAAPFIDMLYPKGSSVRIPVVAVTGTNGKTTVVRLIAHLAKQAKHYVGFTTTDGIYLDGKLIHRGDCSGPVSAMAILREPTVDFAVLECARGGILRSGLGFDQCDISVITNITNDHLGLDDIHSMEELARVKAVVAHSTCKNGYAILNAEDDLVYAIQDDLHCNIALFALAETPRIKRHCDVGGLAAFIERDAIVISRGKERQILAKVKTIPLTFHGTATLMIKNILPAALAGVISGFTLKDIEQALYNFYPSVEHTPARMNIFDFDDFKIMVDYAHNEDAYVELQKFFSQINCSKKIGIIAASGDRRAEDIQKLGYRSAQMFDEIIIWHYKDSRGRMNQEITDLLLQGIESANFHAQVQVISDEFTAVRYAIATAKQNSFIFYSVDDVFDAVEFILEEKRKFKEETIIA
ncbi:cyanophycin synthetase [Legionella lansingensis]|uniref:Cyanophycin synthetase n=1 Tax=Legionella lansingensis TaxID=45067 RepID=A0A0W0VTQ7_9GAMM|nr:cyanophycin synthetase [Legionella lansingensis]KTD23636.1 cyanophycin synthetase [Legionella lansingensis]SNV52490.1 cyanophycin synthetase [Legionella lansingensis]